MPLINQTIPNLINGVSQQPAALRLPTQHEAQLNCYPSVVEGLEWRPPTEHIAKLFSNSMGSAFMHRINRDTTERYFVVIRQNEIKVFDIDGTPKTVNSPDGTAYLNEADPKTAFWALTVADYTFILNMNKTVAMTADLSPVRPTEGLIFVKKGEYGTKYRAFVNGVEHGFYETSPTNPTTLDTSVIAEDLRGEIAAGVGAGWTVTRNGSVIHIKKDDGADFSLKVEDGQGGDSIKAIKTKVQKFSDLPAIAPNGIVLEIDSDPESDSDSYFVKFEVSNVGDTFGEGTWVETVKPGIKYKLDATTMPHVLIREADGTFTYKKQTWADRVAGDEDTAKEPSFVGSKINDIYFRKKRLGFLSDENNILSEVGEYFNFWPVTVTQNLDSDRIDTSASHIKVSKLRHAVPHNSGMVLFSDQTQFLLGSDGALTSKTVKIDQTTDFETNLRTKPIGVGKNIFFVTNKGDYHGVREFFVDPNTVSDSNDSIDVTAHVPTYIPAGAFKLTASTIEENVILLTEGYKPGFFLYKYFRNGQDKVQSAWVKCQVGHEDKTEVLFVEFIETTVYFIIQRSDGVYLEKLQLSPGRVDPFSTYITHLDRRITDADLVSRTYDSLTDSTTLVLPYVVDDTMRVVTRADSATPTEVPGRTLTISFEGGLHIIVRGDWTTQPLWIGQKMTAITDLTTFYFRRQSQTGGMMVESSGRLQIQKMTVVYSKSGYFKFIVSPIGKPVSEYVFNGRIVGDVGNTLGQPSLSSGEFSVPILSRNTQVSIRFITDSFLPFHLIQIKWVGLYVAKSQSM